MIYWKYINVIINIINRLIVLYYDIFFFLFTPISLLMRLFGRDELLLKLNNKESYWKERKIEESVIDRFKKQF